MIELDRLALSGACTLGSGFHVAQSCLCLGFLAITGDAEGEETTAADLSVYPSNVAIFLDFFRIPVILLRFPWHGHQLKMGLDSNIKVQREAYHGEQILSRKFTEQ